MNQKYLNNNMMQDKIDKLKWQIHAETASTSAMLWLIIITVNSYTWLDIMALVFLLLNVNTCFRAASKLGKDYFKS